MLASNPGLAQAVWKAESQMEEMTRGGADFSGLPGLAPAEP